MESEKNKSSINMYTNKNITKLDELIYAGAKLVCEKIRVPLKSTNKQIKTWMENSTGNPDKKATKMAKNDKTKEKRRNMLGQKGKGNARKNYNTNWGI